jgi:hypothetical protein
MRRPGCWRSRNACASAHLPRGGTGGVRLGQGHDKVANPERALISVDCPRWRDASVRSALNGTPLRFHQKSEHAMGQACRSLTVACPFSNASTAEMQKRFSRGDAVLELCTRLSLKEFGSVLNFLRTTFHSTERHRRARLFHSHRYLFSPSEICLSHIFHILLPMKL